MHRCELAPLRLALILLVAVVLGFLPELHGGEFSTGEKQTQFLTERGLSSKLPQTIKATAFIVDHDKKMPDGGITFLRVLASEERNLTEEETKQLLLILEDRRTYFPDQMKACGPTYEIGVTLISRTNQTEILFCFSCDFVRMSGDTASSGGCIDRGHNKLLEFFRGLFPNNGALKKVAMHDQEPKLTPDSVIDLAQVIAPEDPLLKRIKGMRREELTENLLEELMERTAQASWKR